MREEKNELIQLVSMGLDESLVVLSVRENSKSAQIGEHWFYFDSDYVDESFRFEDVPKEQLAKDIADAMLEIKEELSEEEFLYYKACLEEGIVSGLKKELEGQMETERDGYDRPIGYVSFGEETIEMVYDKELKVYSITMHDKEGNPVLPYINGDTTEEALKRVFEREEDGLEKELKLDSQIPESNKEEYLKLARVLIEAFNKEKENILNMEQDVQEGFEYTLTISKDGTRESEVICEKLVEEDIIALLSSGKGYICGYHSADTAPRGHDIYFIGEDAIQHEYLGEASSTTIAQLVETYDKANARMAESVKEWFVKTYPTDSLGAEISAGLSFAQFYEGMKEGKDVYQMLGVTDSFVRECVFGELGQRLGATYDELYNLWVDGPEKEPEPQKEEKPKIDVLIRKGEQVVKGQEKESNGMDKAPGLLGDELKWGR